MAKNFFFKLFQEVDVLGNHCHFFIYLLNLFIFFPIFLRRSLCLSKASSAGVSLILKVEWQLRESRHASQRIRGGSPRSKGLWGHSSPAK